MSNDSHISPNGKFWEYAVEYNIPGRHIVCLTQSLEIAILVLNQYCTNEDEHGQFINGSIYRFEAGTQDIFLGFTFSKNGISNGVFMPDGTWSFD